MAFSFIILPDFCIPYVLSFHWIFPLEETVNWPLVSSLSLFCLVIEPPKFLDIWLPSLKFYSQPVWRLGMAMWLMLSQWDEREVMHETLGRLLKAKLFALPHWLRSHCSSHGLREGGFMLKRTEIQSVLTLNNISHLKFYLVFFVTAVNLNPY